MSEILPPEQDDFLLQQLAARAVGGATTQDLAAAGSQVKEKFGWMLQQYGESIERLVDARLIKAEIQRDGSGNFSAVIPTQLTDVGRDRYKRLREETDPE